MNTVRYSSIPDVDDVDGDIDHPASKSRLNTLVTTGIVLVIGGLALMNRSSASKSLDSMESNDAQLSSFDARDSSFTEYLSVSNEYERRTGTPLGDHMYPTIDHMVQVHKETKFELASKRFASWHVQEKSSMDTVYVSEVDSASIDVTLTKTGDYIIHAVVDSDETHQFSATAKIIRYELRSLSSEDRNVYFSALRKFYWISQEDGESIYGSSYQSLTYLLRQHLYGAADKACDHWHDAAGILTHHVGITWEFENSMRLIDETTAAHYWDYTIESKEGVKWYDSIIFDDDWFGENSPNNADHAVSKGRFGYTPIMKDARMFSHITNPYGLLRSPWNTNPVPYLLRHNKTVYDLADGNTRFPNCTDFASYISNGSITFSALAAAVNGQLHGPVHLMIGGHWGMKHDFFKVDKQGYSTSDDFLLTSKFLWRQGFVRTPNYCSDDTPHSECTASCPEKIMRNISTHEFLEHTGFWNITAIPNQFVEDSISANLTTQLLIEEFCHVGSAGEMFTSAAPQDPTFWPLHGNAERYLQYIRILGEKNIIDYNQTWGYDHEDSASDTHVVCDWAGVEGEFERPTCKKEVCAGHKLNDLLPFEHLMSASDDKVYSNKEFYELISPYNHELPYAYDGLDTWRGCTNNSLTTEADLTL